MPASPGRRAAALEARRMRHDRLARSRIRCGVFISKSDEAGRAPMSSTSLIALAGLMGAAGVVLLAASAHAAPGAGLDSAGQMLLFHAAAVVATAAALHQGLVLRPLALAAAIGLIVGATVV